MVDATPMVTVYWLSNGAEAEVSSASERVSALECRSAVVGDAESKDLRAGKWRTKSRVDGGRSRRC